MSLGLPPSALTTLPVIVSLIGIAAGLIVVGGMLGAHRLPGSTAVFLASTVLTSVTGLLLPFSGRLPTHEFAILSLVVLALLAHLGALAVRWFHPARPIGGAGAAPASRPL